jgi:signal transduction histidine kinase
MTVAFPKMRLWTFGKAAPLLLMAFACFITVPSASAGSPTLVEAQRLNDEARAQLNISPEATIALAKSAAKQAQKAPQTTARDRLLSESEAVTSRALISLGRIDDAEVSIRRGFALAKRGVSSSKITGELTLASGRVRQFRDDVQGALGAFQKAYAMFRAAGDKRSQAVALQSIAKLYLDGGDSENALKYYAQSDGEYGGDPLLSLSSRNNRGIAYLLLNKPREAEIEFQKAFALAEKSGSAIYSTRIFGNIAKAQIKQGKLDEASKTLDRAFASLTGKEASAEAWRFWQRRAEVAFARNDMKAATISIEKALAGVDPESSDSTYREAHNIAYEIYFKSNRGEDALIHARAAWRLDSEAAELTASNSAALMAARFDFANQNARIAQMKANELELERNFLIAIVTGGALALLLLTASLILITRSRNRERAAKHLLAQTNRDLEKAIAAKMEFLATTSHEIRTPLNGILGMTQVMLNDRKLDPTLRDRIGIVHDAGEAMRTLVDDILDMAKMETGKLAVGTGTVDLKATLQQVAQVWRLQADAAGINLALSLDDCPEVIEGDVGRIRQIIFNLLSNAMKFTERGTVELSVSTSVGAHGPRVLIAVRDSGIGIAPEWHESIFELFQQVDGGTTRKYGGTGLGLAICRNLARAMGGDISLESEAGFGSTFTVDLPLVVPAAANSNKADSASRHAVLVIEHNPLTRGMMRAILSERFDSISFVSDVTAACGHLAMENVHWLVADVSSVDNFERLFEATDLPTILVEGADPAPAEWRNRAHVVLPKPLTKSALLAVFERADDAVAA